jgi:hypothetical protein
VEEEKGIKRLIEKTRERCGLKDRKRLDNAHNKGVG